MTIADPSGCDVFDREAMAERYVAGALSPAETEAFEAHLLECERCREEVRLAEAIRAAVLEDDMGHSGEVPDADEEEPESPGGSRAGGRGPLPAWLRVAATLALAATVALVAFVLLRPGQIDPELSELGRVVQAPVYLGTFVRAPADRADSLFAAAMDAYVVEDYSSAVDGLRATLAAGGDEPPVQFFLGASLLMLDRPGEAIEALESVEEAGDSPYLTEARFYRAKAFLQQGETRDALELLRSVASVDSPVADHATALVDSVRAAMR